MFSLFKPFLISYQAPKLHPISIQAPTQTILHNLGLFPNFLEHKAIIRFFVYFDHIIINFLNLIIHLNSPTHVIYFNFITNFTNTIIFQINNIINSILKSNPITSYKSLIRPHTNHHRTSFPSNN